MDGEKSRVERERRAYDEDGVWDVSDRWHGRAGHVFLCPNTLHHERIFHDTIRRHAGGGRALELGCGDGASAERVLEEGADHVLGLEVSERFLAGARRRSVPGRLEFRGHDVHAPLEGRFDLVFGRSILHHVEYRRVLPRLYDRNLAPGGAMVFMEPLGSNLISLVYRMLVRDGHTPDERPFTRRDLRWFRATFEDVEIHPFNYTSYPVGIVSSYVARDADNPALRLCDAADRWLARNVPALESRFRHVVIVVRKAASEAVP